MNLDGEVVGINTRGQSGGIGLGFAVPLDSAFDDFGPVVKEAVAKNKAENMIKKAERARVEDARAARARVAAEYSAVAKEKVKQNVAQLREELDTAVRKAKMAEESTPPESIKPSGTSATNCCSTACNSFSSKRFNNTFSSVNAGFWIGVKEIYFCG